MLGSEIGTVRRFKLRMVVNLFLKGLFYQDETVGRRRNGKDA
jgi:hypothetical protein